MMILVVTHPVHHFGYRPRKIQILRFRYGKEFVVRDSMLTTEDSSNIRNLSRNSIARDQVISASETRRFAIRMKNMDAVTLLTN